MVLLVTNRAMKATFSKSPRPEWKNDLDHPDCWFACKGSDLIIIDVTDRRVGAFECKRLPESAVSLDFTIAAFLATVPW